MEKDIWMERILGDDTMDAAHEGHLERLAINLVGGDEEEMMAALEWLKEDTTLSKDRVKVINRVGEKLSAAGFGDADKFEQLSGMLGEQLLEVVGDLYWDLYMQGMWPDEARIRMLETFGEEMVKVWETGQWEE